MTIPSDRRTGEEALLTNIKRNLPALTRLRDRAQSHWGAEDLVYRFYHQSFKVFGIQTLTLALVEALRALLPDATLDPRFLRIIESGTGKTFTYDMNAAWDAATRPLLEAFFHAEYFLVMAVKYGEELTELPGTLPSGWAALLRQYDLR